MPARRAVPAGNESRRYRLRLGRSRQSAQRRAVRPVPGLRVPIFDLVVQQPRADRLAVRQRRHHPADTSGVADFPWYPLDAVADVNACLSRDYVHDYAFDVSLARRCFDVAGLRGHRRRHQRLLFRDRGGCRCSVRCARWGCRAGDRRGRAVLQGARGTGLRPKHQAVGANPGAADPDVEPGDGGGDLLDAVGEASTTPASSARRRRRFPRRLAGDAAQSDISEQTTPKEEATNQTIADEHLDRTRQDDVDRTWPGIERRSTHTATSTKDDTETVKVDEPSTESTAVDAPSLGWCSHPGRRSPPCAGDASVRDAWSVRGAREAARPVAPPAWRRTDHARRTHRRQGGDGGAIFRPRRPGGDASPRRRRIPDDRA